MTPTEVGWLCFALFLISNWREWRMVFFFIFLGGVAALAMYIGGVLK